MESMKTRGQGLITGVKTPVTMTPVIIYRRQHKVPNISATFRKNSKWPKWDTQGPGGNWFMRKTEDKNLVSDSLENGQLHFTALYLGQFCG
jgi:hypothetical protein